MTAASAATRLHERIDVPSWAPTPDWRLVAGFAASTILIHFLTNGAYGYFRDELYFVACGDHLAAGYVDLPPMVAIIAKLSRLMLGDSLFALRFFPALAGGATVAIAGILAWEFNGGRFAQMLAMLAAMTAPIYLGLDTLLTMNAFDPIFWMGCVWALIRLIKTGDPRWWLMFGVAAGLGLENKESMLFLGFAIIAGLALTPERKLLFNRWIWLGGAIALVIFMPTLIWQAVHNFPMLEELANVKASDKNAPIGWFGFISQQFIMLAPLAFPVWGAGLWYFLVAERGRKFRALGWTYVVLFAAFVMLKGKVYYLAPIYPVLFAAGSVQLESVSASVWQSIVRYVLPAMILIEGVAVAPMALPVLPVETYIRYKHILGAPDVTTETRKLNELPQVYSDMFGWPEMVATVAKVYWSLPPDDRKEAAILARNYGEAGAIDFFGPRYGLPKAISGHMAYYLWGPRDYSGKVVVAIGSRREGLERAFGRVEQVATVGTEYSMPDEHAGVFVCRDPKYTLKQLWPLAKIYN